MISYDSRNLKKTSNDGEIITTCDKNTFVSLLTFNPLITGLVFFPIFHNNVSFRYTVCLEKDIDNIKIGK